MGWNKRKLIRITSVDALTNYQVRIVVSRNIADATIPDGVYNGETRVYAPEAQDDFADIRFFSHAGVAIPAYLDTITDSRATWWIKIPTVYQGNTTIYITYDNPDATIYSSETVFDFVEKYDATLSSTWKNAYSGGQYAIKPDVRTAWNLIPVPTFDNPITQGVIQPWIDDYTNESDRFEFTYLEPVEGTNWERRFWMDFGQNGLTKLASGALATTNCAQVAVSVGKYVYIFGGSDLRDDIVGYEVDPDDGSLTALTGLSNLPYGLANAAAVSVGNYIYILGGWTGEDRSSDIIGFEVNPDNGSLTALTGLPNLAIAREAHAAAASGNYIYVFGGEVTGGGLTNTIEGFEVDPDDGSLTALSISATIGTARCIISAASVGSFMYVFGGKIGTSYYTTITGFKVITATGALTSISPGRSLEVGRACSATVSIGTSIFVLGGCTSSGPTSDIEGFEVNQLTGVLTVKTGLPTLNAGKSQVCGSTVGTYIYLFGGWIGATKTDTIDKFQYDVTVGLYPWPLGERSIAIFRDEYPFNATYAGGATGSIATVAYYGTETDQVIGLRILHELLHATGIDSDQMVDNDKIPFGNYLQEIDHEDADTFQINPVSLENDPDLQQVYYEWLLSLNDQGGIYIQGGALRTIATFPINKIVTIYGTLTIVDGTAGFGLADTSGNSAFFGNSVVTSPVNNVTETGVTSVFTRNSLSENGEHVYEIIRTASSAKFYVDGLLVTENTSNIPQGSLPLSFICTGFESEVWVSQAFVRNYAANVPYVRYTRIEDADTHLGWLRNLRCRKLITVENTDTTDYNYICRTRICRNATPLPTNLYNLHVILNGKCRSDFLDIQFTEMDGVTVIENYLEYAAPNHADFVLKIPIRYTGNTYLYLYYNGERLRSDPVHQRFADRFYESFNSIPAAYWNQVGNTSNAGSIATVEANELSPYTHNYIRSKETFTGPVRMVARVKFTMDTADYDYSLFGFVGQNLNDTVGFKPMDKNAWFSGSGGERKMFAFDGQYHVVSINWRSTSTVYYMEVDSEPQFIDGRYYPGSQSNDLNIFISAYHFFQALDVDWLFVTDYAYGGNQGLSYGTETQLFTLQTPDFSWEGTPMVDIPVQFVLINQNSFVAWDFGDGFISYESNPEHTYHTAGTYTVTLKAADSDGNPQLTISHEIDVKGAGYLGYDIEFDASVRFGQIPLTVQFYNQSPDADSWVWDFGDGTTSTDKHPTHIYTHPQTYTVKLVSTTGSDDYGHIKENFIRATELDIPIAGFTMDPDVETGTSPFTITLTDESTGTITSSYWDINNEVFEGDDPLLYTCVEPGIVIIKRVVKNEDWIDEQMTSIYIKEQPTMQIYPSPSTGFAPIEVEFRSLIPFMFKRVLWNFGDDTTSTVLIPSHTYTIPGSYTVTFQVWKESILYPVETTIIYEVKDPANLPVPDFSGSVVSGNAPLQITFTDLTTGTVTAWSWNLGDGTRSTSHNPVHTYLESGIYTVTLKATNTNGDATVTKTNYITVYDLPIAAFLATYTGPGVTTPEDADMLPADDTWIVQFTDLTEHIPTSWVWDFGDGETSLEQNPVHTFDTIGKSYWVELAATNPAGTDTIGMDITVLPDDYTIPEFEYQILTHMTPYQILFTPLGDVPLTDSHAWDFGDGKTSTERIPTHEYLFPGTYVVVYTRIMEKGVITRRCVIEVI
jgi:PKD repeat protein